MSIYQCDFCSKIYSGKLPQMSGCKNSETNNHMWKDITNNKGNKYQCTKCGKIHNGTLRTKSGCPKTTEGNHMWIVLSKSVKP